MTPAQSLTIFPLDDYQTLLSNLWSHSNSHLSPPPLPDWLSPAQAGCTMSSSATRRIHSLAATLHFSYPESLKVLQYPLLFSSSVTLHRQCFQSPECPLSLFSHPEKSSSLRPGEESHYVSERKYRCCRQIQTLTSLVLERRETQKKSKRQETVV